MEEEKKEKETIIVKGVDKELKEAIKTAAELTGKAMSDVIREALRFYVSAKEIGSTAVKEITTGIKEITGVEQTTIKSIGELTLTKEDLLGFKGKVILLNIGKLEFADDVTLELFEEKISKIVDVKELIIPKSIPKFVVLPKSSHIGKIIIK